MKSDRMTVDQWREAARAEIENEEQDFRNRFNADKIDFEALQFFFWPPDRKGGRWYPRALSEMCGFARKAYRMSDGLGWMYRHADLRNSLRIRLRFGNDVADFVGWQEVDGCSEEIFRRLTCLILLSYSPKSVLRFALNEIDPEDHWWEEQDEKTEELNDGMNGAEKGRE